MMVMVFADMMCIKHFRNCVPLDWPNFRKYFFFLYFSPIHDKNIWCWHSLEILNFWIFPNIIYISFANVFFFIFIGKFTPVKILPFNALRNTKMNILCSRIGTYSFFCKINSVKHVLGIWWFNIIDYVKRNWNLNNIESA